MTKIETIENMARTILADESKVLGTDEYNILISNSKSEEERELYTELYNYFLKKKHAEVLKNVQY